MASYLRKQIAMIVMRYRDGIRTSLCGICMIAALHAACGDDIQAQLIVLKQDVPQYNRVWHRARAALADAKRFGDPVVVDIDPLRTVSTLPNSDPTRDVVLSIGTDAFRTATAAYPEYAHVYGMIIGIDIPSAEAMAARSGKAVSGLSILIDPEAYIAYIKRIHRRHEKIGFLYSSDTFSRYAAVLSAVAARQGIDAVFRKVDKKEDFVNHFNAVIGAGIDVFLIIPDFSLLDAKSLERVLIDSYNRGIPCIGPSESFVNSGALWAFEVSPESIGEQLAEIVIASSNVTGLNTTYFKPDKVCLNMKTAEDLEIKVPYRVRKDAKLFDPRDAREE